MIVGFPDAEEAHSTPPLRLDPELQGRPLLYMIRLAPVQVHRMNVTGRDSA
jgi:hypothetical protein